MNQQEKTEFKYMMLNRLQMDCKYFLGWGNGNPNNLWALNVKDQIQEMKKRWNELDEKPVWLTMEQIEQFERDMTA